MRRRNSRSGSSTKSPTNRRRASCCRRREIAAGKAQLTTVDGALAYFGFPTADEDDQVRAVEAGLDIVRLVPEAGRRLGVELGSRVGIHVGRTVMTSSELGVRERSTAVGFATNVAARIQGV